MADDANDHEKEVNFRMMRAVPCRVPGAAAAGARAEALALSDPGQQQFVAPAT